MTSRWVGKGEVSKRLSLRNVFSCPESGGGERKELLPGRREGGAITPESPLARYREKKDMILGKNYAKKGEGASHSL